MEKIVRGKFTLPSGRTTFYKMKIAPSTINGAGMGVFSVDFIPKGAKGVYRGVIRNAKNADFLYSWCVREFDPVTGEGEKITHYIDASNPNPKVSNWTRYVNCGLTSNDNNFVCEQQYKKILYISERDIQIGEELFIDYGEEYRTNNLNIDDTSY